MRVNNCTLIKYVHSRAYTIRQSYPQCVPLDMKQNPRHPTVESLITVNDQNAEKKKRNIHLLERKCTAEIQIAEESRKEGKKSNRKIEGAIEDTNSWKECKPEEQKMHLSKKAIAGKPSGGEIF